MLFVVGDLVDQLFLLELELVEGSGEMGELVVPLGEYFVHVVVLLLKLLDQRAESLHLLFL